MRTRPRDRVTVARHERRSRTSAVLSAASRLDMRRALVVREANAIGTAIVGGVIAGMVIKATGTTVEAYEDHPEFTHVPGPDGGH